MMMEITPEECTFVEDHISDREYSCRLMYEGKEVSSARMNNSLDFRINGNTYSGWMFKILFVSKEFRGNGLGSYTLERMLDYAREHNLPLIGTVSRDLDFLTEFYSRHGFTEIQKNVIYWTPQ